MSATPLYLLSTKNDASANPVHILTNGKASFGSNSSQIIDSTSEIISNCSLNMGSSNNLTNTNVYGTYFSNNSSAILLPADVSANRPPGQVGYIRFNTTINLIEFWDVDSNSWVPLDIPPEILSISPTTVTQSNFPITINGYNFSSGCIVRFIDTNTNIFLSPSVTFVNSNQIIALTPSPALTTVGQPFSVRVTNPSGRFATLSGALNTGSGPIFINSAGSIGNIYTGVSSELQSYTNSLLSVKASDPDLDIITYSYTGSLPPGLSLDSSGNINGVYNGVFNSPSASPTSTTYSFTVSAITQNATSTRTFTITVIQPTLVSYSYTGSANIYSIPTGVLYITTKMWGGGGANYFNNAGWSGSGAPGGFTETTFNVIESTLTVVVAGGGGSGVNSYESYAYGGGGNAANGGGAGGGASMVLSGSITTPFATTNTGSLYNYNAPQSSLLSLNGAQGIIAVTGGGGGAGWYNFDNMNGGTGGGIIGGNAFNGSTQPTGGTQSTGGTGGSLGTGSYNVAASKFAGGRPINNSGGNGGSGGGGGGWFGGGCYQENNGNNAGGGGGSGFAGYVNGSTITLLTGSNITIGLITYPSSYEDFTTRINGTRIYKNTRILRSPDLGSGTVSTQQLPPLTTDIYWSSGIGAAGGEGNTVIGGNGKVVLIF